MVPFASLLGLVMLLAHPASSQFYLGQWLEEEDGESLYMLITPDSITFAVEDADDGCFEFNTVAYSANGDVLTVQDDEEPFDLNASMNGDVLLLNGVGNADGLDYELQPNGDDLGALIECSEDGTTNVEHVHGSSFSVYPNPARSSVTLVASQLPAQCRIYNVEGRVVFDQVIQASPLILERHSWKSGLYLVKIQSGDKVQSAPIVFE